MDKATMVDDAKEYFDTWREHRLTETVGTDFLSRLDKKDILVTDAYWAMSEDGEVRRLFIATPLRDKNGLRATGLAFHEVFYSMSDEERAGVTMGDVSIVSPQSQSVKDMRRRYGTVDYGNGYRIRNNNNSLTEPFIYRLNYAPAPIAPATASGQQPTLKEQHHG